MLPGYPPRRPCAEADLPLRELSAVVIDFETTGLYPNQGDEIIELGAIYVDGLEIRSAHVFERLVNPGRPVSEGAFKVHRIPDETLAAQPPVASILPEFVAFLSDRWVVGQNLVFDLSFLMKSMRRCGMPSIQNPVIDTRWLSKLVFPHMNHHSLDAIAQRLDVQRPTDRHRALGDVIFTAEILVRLFQRCMDRGYERIGDVLEAYEHSEGGRYGEGDVVAQLERGYHSRQVVEVAYMSPGSSPDEVRRKVSIYYMAPPYLIGFCHTRHAIRTFRIDRVASVAMLEDAYTIPSEFHPQDHFLRR